MGISGNRARCLGARGTCSLVPSPACSWARSSGGCSSTNDAAKALNPDPPGKMYADADRLLNNGAYSDAAKKFEDLDRDHPYAPEARRAMVMAAYAYYKAGKYPEAIASAKRYTTMHPGTKDAALAHHIIASANFDEIKDPSAIRPPPARRWRSSRRWCSAIPTAPTAKQAINRIRIAEDVLAASEMNVGRYYQQRNNHVAAINRFKTVVTEYQTTLQVEEALYRICEANMTLGIVARGAGGRRRAGAQLPELRMVQARLRAAEVWRRQPADAARAPGSPTPSRR